MLTIIFSVLIIIVFALTIVWLSADQNTALKQQSLSHYVDTIEDLLPQTQCSDCGFQGCRPYAEAIAQHSADINRCLPGGEETVKALAHLLGVASKPLYQETDKYQQKNIAVIDETVCIGCVKCIKACPVDAIIGAPKQMHSVINQYCTGCELCITPCPVDCIDMVATR